MADRRSERIARNESAFRALNETLESSVHRGRSDEDFAGFVCECGNPDCDEIIRLELPTYESIRRDAQLFFVVPGHELPDAEDVFDHTDGHIVVRKHEDVAELVDETSQRQGD
jgi:hypothetical protein